LSRWGKPVLVVALEALRSDGGMGWSRAATRATLRLDCDGATWVDADVVEHRDLDGGPRRITSI
jgi:hypothetical protein